MAAGITQPGGAGSTVFVHDNLSSASGLGYTRAEIATAFPADFIDNLTGLPSYRAKVTVQIGDATTDAATTTLLDTNTALLFDSGKVLQTRATQLTSWNIKTGSKVGSGNAAGARDGSKISTGGATTYRGNFLLYGSTIECGGGALNFTPAVSGSGSEIVDCKIRNRGTSITSQIGIGTATLAVANVYNVDIDGDLSSPTNALLTAFNTTNAERITIAISGAGAFIRTGVAQTTLAVKDMVLYGVPNVADISVPAFASSPSWDFVKPVWSGGAPRFTFSAILSAGAIRESWLYPPKLAALNGTGISGMSLVVTDALGNVLVNTMSNSVGEVAYSSGLTANSLIVRDHYATAGPVYTTRDRFPYLVEVNTVNTMAGFQVVRFYMMPPGSASGNFGDMGGTIPVGPSTTVPLTVDQVPLPAHGEVRFESVIPAIV